MARHGFVSAYRLSSTHGWDFPRFFLAFQVCVWFCGSSEINFLCQATNSVFIQSTAGLQCLRRQCLCSRSTYKGDMGPRGSSFTRFSPLHRAVPRGLRGATPRRNPIAAPLFLRTMARRVKCAVSLRFFFVVFFRPAVSVVQLKDTLAK